MGRMGRTPSLDWSSPSKECQRPITLPRAREVAQTSNREVERVPPGPIGFNGGVRVASFGIRNPSLSRTGLALHRIDFVSSQRWLLHLRKARAVAGRTGMLSDLGRHGNLSGRLGCRPHFLAYCSPELARYLRAGANRSSGSSCLRGRPGAFPKKERARRQRLSVRFGAMVAELSS